jgi:DNA-directed RNA polymerase specialized sigma24 family protein
VAGDREFLDFFADEFWSLRRLGFPLTGYWGEAEEPAQEAMARTFAAWSRVRHRQPAA